ncbi:MAG: GTP cyclohydrolase I [Oscillospiraceae bacterium]|nr:GTP cyclohydrolase I [Oscillospiraceae bacterium]
MDQARIEAAARELLAAIGEDVTREGLDETPARIARMCAEIFSGLQDDPLRHIKLFEGSGGCEPIVVRDIPVYSVCEHHLLPFFGTAQITYWPNGNRVLGLSKFVRIVDCFARRPQLQERLTTQIANFLFENLPCQKVEVEIEARHLCMTMRGARAVEATTVTRAVRNGNV